MTEAGEVHVPPVAGLECLACDRVNGTELRDQLRARGFRALHRVVGSCLPPLDDQYHQSNKSNGCDEQTARSKVGPECVGRSLALSFLNRRRASKPKGQNHPKEGSPYKLSRR